MNQSTPPDIERIARGLTEPQRRLLLAHHPKLSGEHWRATSARDELSWNISGRGLRIAGLIGWASNSGEDTVITRLGQRVRTHLQEQQP